MKCEGITIDSHAEMAEAMGEPYAFVGGIVDLNPSQAKRVVVMRHIHVDVHLSDVTGFGRYRQHNALYFDDFEEGPLSRPRRARAVLDFDTGPGGDDGIAALLTTAELYEANDLVPEGFVTALREWLTEQGIVT